MSNPADSAEGGKQPMNSIPGVPDGVSARERLVAFYSAYNPEKLETVDAILEMYRGEEAELFADLEEDYRVPIDLAREADKAAERAKREAAPPAAAVAAEQPQSPNSFWRRASGGSPTGQKNTGGRGASPEDPFDSLEPPTGKTVEPETLASPGSFWRVPHERRINIGSPTDLPQQEQRDGSPINPPAAAAIAAGGTSTQGGSFGSGPSLWERQLTLDSPHHQRVKSDLPADFESLGSPLASQHGSWRKLNQVNSGGASTDAPSPDLKSPPLRVNASAAWGRADEEDRGGIGVSPIGPMRETTPVNTTEAFRSSFSGMPGLQDTSANQSMARRFVGDGSRRGSTTDDGSVPNRGPMRVGAKHPVRPRLGAGALVGDVFDKRSFAASTSEEQRHQRFVQQITADVYGNQLQESTGTIAANMVKVAEEAARSRQRRAGPNNIDEVAAYSAQTDIDDDPMLMSAEALLRNVGSVPESVVPLEAGGPRIDPAAAALKLLSSNAPGSELLASIRKEMNSSKLNTSELLQGTPGRGMTDQSRLTQPVVEGDDRFSENSSQVGGRATPQQFRAFEFSTRVIALPDSRDGSRTASAALPGDDASVASDQTTNIRTKPLDRSLHRAQQQNAVLHSTKQFREGLPAWRNFGTYGDADPNVIDVVCTKCGRLAKVDRDCKLVADHVCGFDSELPPIALRAGEESFHQPGPETARPLVFQGMGKSSGSMRESGDGGAEPDALEATRSFEEPGAHDAAARREALDRQSSFSAAWMAPTPSGATGTADEMVPQRNDDRVEAPPERPAPAQVAPLPPQQQPAAGRPPLVPSGVIDDVVPAQVEVVAPAASEKPPSQSQSRTSSRRSSMEVGLGNAAPKAPGAPSMDPGFGPPVAEVSFT